MISSASFSITQIVSPEEKQFVCRNLYGYNVQATHELLRSPGIDINLLLKDEQGSILGGIFCDTFLYCLYIDVLWIDECCRGLGYGKALMQEAERIAREHGCTFAHTCTFTYQAPDFYQHLGYQIFGVLDDYPDGIKQYFLKKKI
jgi:GNAT superfamily N-acetyltransferase